MTIKNRRTKARKKTRTEPRAAEAGTTEILVYGDIGWSWFDEGVTVKRIAEELDAAPASDTILVRINSYGGDAFEGVAIYNRLVTDGRKIITQIDGAAISAASIIAMAGVERRIGENAMLMIHDPWTFAAGDAGDMRSVADMLDLTAESLCKTYERRSNLSFEACRELMREETWMGADEALADGFCTVSFAAEDEGDAPMAVQPGRIAASAAAHWDHPPEKISAAFRDSKRIELSEDRVTLTHGPDGNGIQITAGGAAPVHFHFTAAGADDVVQTFAKLAHHEPPVAKRGDSTEKESTMDIAELQAALKSAQDETTKMRDERDAALKLAAKHEADLKAQTEKVEALEKHNAKIVEERDQARKDAEAAGDKLLAQEVDALVGVKIDPCERDDYLALAKSDRGLFDKFVAQRAEKSLLKDDPAGMGAEPIPTTDDGDEFDRMLAASL